MFQNRTDFCPKKRAKHIIPFILSQKQKAKLGDTVRRQEDGYLEEEEGKWLGGGLGWAIASHCLTEGVLTSVSAFIFLYFFECVLYFHLKFF